jgi:hypothetical protein
MYPSSFHAARHQETSYAASRILSLLFERFPAPMSAIDVGCGIGTFLSVLHDRGVKDILGLDGEWVDKTMLTIEKNQFNTVELRFPPKLQRKYGLAICLEVAEHLPPDCARHFIEWLCEASDVILFSAAIPGQGGVNHFNEAWQSYWVELFAQKGFHLNDFIRPAIWDDKKIAFWYKQNTFVFTKYRDHVHKEYPIPINLVHPEQYEMHMKRGGYYSRLKEFFIRKMRLFS